MTKIILTIYRDEKEVAQLHLDVRPGGSVSGWTWHGDPKVKPLFKRLPNNKYSLEVDWEIDVIRGCEDAGLTYKTRFEGEPLPLLD